MARLLSRQEAVKGICLHSMGMWPFRSKRRKSQARHKPPKSSSAAAMDYSGTPAVRDFSDANSIPDRRKMLTRTSRETKKLRKIDRRTYSFSPGRNDSIRAPKDRPQAPPVPSLPADRMDLDTNGGQSWQRVPTLHKRRGQDLSRRKSSKKRKEEHDREAEIKAMSNTMPTPHRPAVESGSTGRSLKRESKTMKSGLNRHLENPSSDISLPLAESIHSSLSSEAERRHTFKLSTIGVLSPRPTLRYSEKPRYVPGASGWHSDGSETRRKKLSERAPIPQETLDAHKRIDDLANDLDAGDLRELLERDQRRRDRRRLKEQQKIEMKLARRAEKQKAEEAAAAKAGRALPKNMDRGVFGRELMGQDIASETAAPNQTMTIDTAELADTGPGERSQGPRRKESEASVLRGEIPVIETAQIGRMSRASLSAPSSPTFPQMYENGQPSISERMETTKLPAPSPAPEDHAPVLEKIETIRTSSDTNTMTKPPQTWTSFFRRGARSKRASTPSSFSNTSRDSIQNAHLAHLAHTPPTRQSSSTMPRRTMSKFREDLPELPLSPPDSRVGSPEAEMKSSVRRQQIYKRAASATRGETPLPDASSQIRHDTPTSGLKSAEPVSRTYNETPTSGHRSIEAPSPEPGALLSRSLASIDSEGSWLSGRPAGGSRRTSAQNIPTPLRNSSSSLQNRFKEFSESAEELGIAEDEYFSRLTPNPEDGLNRARRKTSIGVLPSSDEEDEGPSPVEPKDTKWYGGMARRPTLVHGDNRAKSREGLLHIVDDAAMDDDEDSSIQRASSINLAKAHVRRISAGSARLLDVKRSSIDSKRLSTGSSSTTPRL